MGLQEFIESLSKEEQNFILEISNERDQLKEKLKISYEAIQKVRDERNVAWTKLEKIKRELYNDLHISEFKAIIKEILEDKKC